MIDRAPRRQTCTDHCSACGQHFHGLAAFDAHRSGPMDARRCLIGVELERVATTAGRRLLQVWTEDGHCELNHEGGEAIPLHPIVIWQTYGAENAFPDLQGNARTPETASGDPGVASQEELAL